MYPLSAFEYEYNLKDTYFYNLNSSKRFRIINNV